MAATRRFGSSWSDAASTAKADFRRRLLRARAWAAKVAARARTDLRPAITFVLEVAPWLVLLCWIIDLWEW